MPPALSPPELPSDLVLFVSSVEGKPVTRLPVRGGRAPGGLIGARREGGKYVYDTAAVVGLTRAEVREHRSYYERVIAEGSLRRRTQEEWERARTAQKAHAAAHAAKNRPATSVGGDRK
jgi:hypothetical protein